MIRLEDDCLMLVSESGESFPCTLASVRLDVLEGVTTWLHPELLQDTVKAVWFYFKHDLQRISVTVKEFSEALQTVFKGLGLDATAITTTTTPPRISEHDLCAVAEAAGCTYELGFFLRLREELRRQVQLSPGMLKFTSLQACVKRLTGARRWNKQCRQLSDQINGYLRACLQADAGWHRCALVVR
jgi:hypothetical protein